MLIDYRFLCNRRRLPKSTRTYTLFPVTTLVRSWFAAAPIERFGRACDRRDLSQSLDARSGSGRRQQVLDVDARRAPEFELGRAGWRSEEHTSELQSLMRISYAVFCL